MKIHTCNFSDYFCIYSKEIYDIFSIYPLNTGSKEADYIITCLSNELNYPKLEDNKKKELEYIHNYWKSFEVK